MLVQMSQIACPEISILGEACLVQLRIVIVSLHDIRALHQDLSHSGLRIRIGQFHIDMFNQFADDPNIMFLGFPSCDQGSGLGQSITYGIGKLCISKELFYLSVKWSPSNTEELHMTTKGHLQFPTNSLADQLAGKGVTHPFLDLFVTLGNRKYRASVYLFDKQGDGHHNRRFDILERGKQDRCNRRLPEKHDFTATHQLQYLSGGKFIDMAYR